MKKGTQPIIEIFSPHESETNSKCEFAHLLQHNPLFSEWSGNSSRLINRRCEWTLMSKTCFCTYYGLKKFQRLSKEDACMLQILLESSNFILIPEHGVTFSYVTILRKHFGGACPFPYPKIPIWKCCRICSGTQGLALSPFPTCCLLVKLIVNLFL